MRDIIAEYKNPFTDYGKKVKQKLIELDKTQSWLIEEVKNKTNKYLDSSSLNKVLTGRLNSKTITEAIDDILDFKSK